MTQTPEIPRLRQALNRGETLAILRRTGGSITVIVGLDWVDLRGTIDSMNTLVQHRIVADEFSLSDISYEMVGFDDQRTEVLVQVTAEVDPIEWEEQEPYVPPTCKKCGSGITKGYCNDETCPYSDWPQAVAEVDLEEKSTAEIEWKYNIRKH